MLEWTKIFNQVSHIKVRSVTDSLFKFGMFALVIAVLSAIFSDKDWVTIIVFIIAVVFIIIGLFFYCYFAIKKPEYLRSETFQTKKQALELLGDNKNSGNKHLKRVSSIVHSYPYETENGNENPMLK